MLSRIQDELNKPYYFFRPGQVFLRLNRKLTRYKPDAIQEEVVLPWGLSIQVHPGDMIGDAIYRAGVYDLCVSEVLWRLLEKAETAVDAGANIGQMTSIMARRVGSEGQVLSFEPHPQIFQELAANVDSWRNDPTIGKIEIYEMGLSKEAGVAALYTTSEFVQNRGTASLETSSEKNIDEGITHSISIERLENVIPSNINVGVMKLDVEGHEIDLLRGASFLLKEKRIRDIIFEEHNCYPSPVTDYLEQQGYAIFGIEQGPFALRISAAKQDVTHYKYDAQSYLATVDAPRALERLSAWGYKSLQDHKNSGKSNVLVRTTIDVALLFGVALFAVWSFASKEKNK